MKNFIFIATLLISTSALASEKVCFEVKGMTCDACESKIKDAVTKIEGVSTLDVSSKTGKAQVEFDSKKTTDATILKAIQGTGFNATKGACS